MAGLLRLPEDGGDVFGGDTMKVQVKAAGKFTPGRSG
jgi:hypothetical protein